MKIAVVGATGLVGGTMLKVLEERGFGHEEIIVAASAKSAGKKIVVAGRELTVVGVEEALRRQPDYALFSAGGAASKQYAPLFAAAGCTVIDNSSAWRQDADKPLVVPEINIDAVQPDDRIIANPNCSTIQMVLAISRLHRRYGIRRLVVSTYQSITGTGMKAIEQLQHEEQLSPATLKEYYEPCRCADCRARHNEEPWAIEPHPRDYAMAYPYQIHRNLFPMGGDFLPNGYTTEEQKLVDETRKILRAPELQVCPTVVRVPVVGGHSESVNLEFNEEYDLEEARRLIAETPGVVLYDDPSRQRYPMPVMAEGRDEVFVGRVRRDPSQPRSLNLWVVADNIRKGAATNAVQILQALTGRK